MTVGNTGDGEVATELLANEDEPVEVLGDCAYGGGETHHDVPVRPLICVHGRPLPRGGLYASRVPIVSPRDIPHMLRSLGDVLDRGQVVAVTARARACFPPAG